MGGPSGVKKKLPAREIRSWPRSASFFRKNSPSPHSGLDRKCPLNPNLLPWYLHRRSLTLQAFSIRRLPLCVHTLERQWRLPCRSRESSSGSSRKFSNIVAGATDPFSLMRVVSPIHCQLFAKIFSFDSSRHLGSR